MIFSKTFGARLCRKAEPGPNYPAKWAQLCLPAQVCAKGFREDQKWNFVPSAPRGEARGLLVFSGEKQTRRSNFGASGPRFTHPNTRHDARQAPDMALPAPISRDSWILAFWGTPLFPTFWRSSATSAAPLRMPPERGAREKVFRSDPDASDAPFEASGSDRDAFSRAPRYGGI